MTTTTTTILTTSPQQRRRLLTIALAFGAGAALGVGGTVLTTGDDTLRPAPATESRGEDGSARTVAEHGSIRAIEHRDQTAAARPGRVRADSRRARQHPRHRTPRPDGRAGQDGSARTVAEHGSIRAIEHRDQMAAAGQDGSARTVAEHDSIRAIEHRDQMAAAGQDGSAGPSPSTTASAPSNTATRWPRPARTGPRWTVAEHDSIRAIEHRDQMAAAGQDGSARTVAEHDSIRAVEHRRPDGRAGQDGSARTVAEHDSIRAIEHRDQ